MSNSNNGGLDSPKLPALSRPTSRQQIKRSLTELASPGKLHRRTHLHRRQDSQLEDKEKEKEKEKPPLSSAMLAAQVRHSLDVMPSSATTPFMSPLQSRRGSVTLARENNMIEEPKEVREALQEQNQATASIRADRLKQSLLDLNSFSSTMTKRLDDTYYSVLEKMSTLQQTVLALKDLAQDSHELTEGFEKASRDLENDIIRQLSAAGQFEEQQRRISALQKRVNTGRDKIQALASRVAVVRQRVEGWERADKRWQEKTRKRLKIIWSVTMVAVLVLVVFIVGFNYADVDRDGAVGGKVAMSPNVPPWLVNKSSNGKQNADAEESGRQLLWKVPRRDNEQLRAFDEL